MTSDPFTYPDASDIGEGDPDGLEEVAMCLDIRHRWQERANPDRTTWFGFLGNNARRSAAAHRGEPRLRRVLPRGRMLRVGLLPYS